MIADQQIGTNFMKALGYNLRKNDHPEVQRRAELLETNFSSLKIPAIRKEVALVKSLRPRLSRYVYHTSLNFSKEEEQSLNNETLLSIAHEYLEAMGYTNNQYFIFRHHDSNHPHLHLLVNRICFDGTVVPDNNNYKRSEAVLRQMEYQYNLLPVEQSSYKVIEQDNGIAIRRTSYTADRAPKKDELEMVMRTGKASDKMVLQEKLKQLLNKHLLLNEFIRQAEGQGICLLFNQASTGYVSRVTYFYNDFMAKGQALGNRFKWAEIIKEINYEQIRDRQAVSEANSRTKAVYGERPGNGERSTGSFTPDKRNTSNDFSEQRDAEGLAAGDGSVATRASQGDPDAHLVDASAADHQHTYHHLSLTPAISDDIDDEAVLGRNRRKKKMSRTNMR